MFARISRRVSGYPEVTVQLCDVRSNRWHKLAFSSSDEVPCQAMSSDGGLVCMVSVTLNGLVRIVVCNPLTRAWRELPSHPLQYDPARYGATGDEPRHKMLRSIGCWWGRRRRPCHSLWLPQDCRVTQTCCQIVYMDIDIAGSENRVQWVQWADIGHRLSLCVWLRNTSIAVS